MRDCDNLEFVQLLAMHPNAAVIIIQNKKMHVFGRLLPMRRCGPVRWGVARRAANRKPRPTASKAGKRPQSEIETGRRAGANRQRHNPSGCCAGAHEHAAAPLISQLFIGLIHLESLAGVFDATLQVVRGLGHFRWDGVAGHVGRLIALMRQRHAGLG